MDAETGKGCHSPLEMAIQVGVSHHCVLETELKFSERVTGSLNCWALSPAHACIEIFVSLNSLGTLFLCTPHQCIPRVSLCWRRHRVYFNVVQKTASQTLGRLFLPGLNSLYFPLKTLCRTVLGKWDYIYMYVVLVYTWRSEAICGCHFLLPTMFLVSRHWTQVARLSISAFTCWVHSSPLTSVDFTN